MNKEIINQTAFFVKEAAESVNRLETENTQLKDKVASLTAQNTTLEKSASVQPSVSVDTVGSVVSNLIHAGLLKESSRNAAVSAMTSDPMSSIEFLDKLATESLKKTSLPSLGSGVKQKTASVVKDERASDAHFNRIFGSKH